MQITCPSADGKCKANLYGDCTRLTRIFSNFLSNSAKHSPQGSVVCINATVVKVDPVAQESTDPEVQLKKKDDTIESDPTMIKGRPTVLRKRLLIRVDIIDEGYGMDEA